MTREIRMVPHLKISWSLGIHYLREKRESFKTETVRREKTQPCSTLMCSANAFRVLSIRLSISNATTVHTLKKNISKSTQFIIHYWTKPMGKNIVHSSILKIKTRAFL